MKINLKIINYKSYSSEFLCALIMYFSFLSFTNRFGSVTKYLTVGCALLLWGYLLITKLLKKKLLIIIASIIAYDIVFALFGRGNLASIICYLPVSLFLLKKKLKSKIWIIVPCIIVVDLLLAWARSPNKYILYEGVSRNYISVFAMYAFTIITIYCEKRDKEVNLLFVVCLWLISLSAIGRGGIIATSVVLVLFVLQRFIFNGEKIGVNKLCKILVLFILLICFLIVIANNLEYVRITYFGRFFGKEASAASSSAYRSYMLVEYLRQMGSSFKNLLFGCDADVISSVSGNLHNSYLQLHSKFGIIGLLFVTVGSVRTVHIMSKKKHWQYVFVYIGLLIRAITDWCFPGVPVDIFLWYFILYPDFEMKLPTSHIKFNTQNSCRYGDLERIEQN